MISHKIWCDSFSCDGQCSDLRPEYIKHTSKVDAAEIASLRLQVKELRDMIATNAMHVEITRLKGEVEVYRKAMMGEECDPVGIYYNSMIEKLDLSNARALYALKKFFVYFNNDGITAEQLQEKEQNFNEFTDLAQKALDLGYEEMCTIDDPILMFDDDLLD